MRKVGVDKFMWGSDYPHHESTYPYTREGLRRAFAGAPVRRAAPGLLRERGRACTASTSSGSRPFADRVGPTVDELAQPFEGIPDGNRSPAFSRR